MATRGRPKAQPKPEPLNSKEQIIAEILARDCGIPGCGPKNHEEVARKIMQVVRGEN